MGLILDFMLTDKEKFIALTQLITLEDKEKVDAIILLEGDGFNRIPRAVELMQKTKSILVFSGNIDDDDYGSFTLKKCLPIFLKYNLRIEDIVFEDKSRNTREQAENIIDMACKQKWGHIVLIASQYHQYRAFLTFLKVLIELNMDRKILVSNCPCELNWFIHNPWGARFDLLDSEFDRIEKYSEKGHVASFSQALNYYSFWKI